jgi:alkylation response protein AidB-like acyl-CoA dehydrogenase
MSMSEQERHELQSSLCHMLDRASSSEAVRSFLEDPLGHDRDLWQQLVELGYTSIHVPEEFGGAGASYADLAVVLHELGRHLTPGPFFADAVLATGALLAGDNTDLKSELLPKLVAGERIGTVAVVNGNGSVEPGELSMRWTEAGGGVRLSGTAVFVPDAHVADFMVVAARAEDGDPLLAVVDTAAPGVSVQPMAMVDLTRRASTVVLDGVEVSHDRLLCGRGAPATQVLERVLALAAIALMADATGVAQRVVETAAEYANERMQFGRPIGSFQAVKHHCANMLIAVECSKAATAAGIDALDNPSEGLRSAAAVAKSYAGPACSEVAALGIQVHGGIGFTWEHDSHLFLKRAKFDEAWFGSPSWHRRRLVRWVLEASNSER